MKEGRISGFCAPRFERVRAAFQLNFEGDGSGGDTDLGASVSATLGGETVVDLWGGYCDLARTAPWRDDTIVCVFSVTKAVAALCMHVLHSRGALDIDAPIAEHWPEFGCNGKEKITARMVLSHQAGLLCPNVIEGTLWRPGAMVRAIEVMTPEWPPGTAAGYHSFTYGPILQELTLRTTGRTLGAFLRDELARPFAADFAVGLTPTEDARRAHLVNNNDNSTIRAFRFEPESPVYKHWAALPRTEDFNSIEWRQQEFFSLNGHGNARGIARLLAPLATDGTLDGKRLIKSGHLAGAIAEHWSGIDRVAGCPGRFAAGFQMSDALYPFGGYSANFGFYGIGGNVGFADPLRGLSFSYCCNRPISGAAGTNPLSVQLIETFYACLENT